MYSTALTATQVAQLYNSTSSNPTANLLPTTTPVTIGASPATLDLNGNNQTVASLADSGGGGGTVTSSATNSIVLTLAPTTSTSFSGNIQNGSGTVGLTINGTGTQTLAGTANSYSGATTITAGILQLASNTGLPASTVTINAANGLSFRHQEPTRPAIGGAWRAPRSSSS